MENLNRLDNVTVWLNNVCNSEATKRGYAARIKFFGEYLRSKTGLNLEQLKEKYREAKYKGEVEREKFKDKLEDVIGEFLAYVSTLDYSPSHIKQFASIISSYVKKGCGILDVKVNIPKRAVPKYHNRDITKEEIRRILEHCSLRDKAFFMFMVESGLRPSTILQLRYKHIKEDYERGTIPMKVLLPSCILKDRIPDRWTFLGEDGVRILREYLSTRGQLKDDDLIFLPERPSRVKGKETVGETAMSQKFNKLVLKLGLAQPRKDAPRKPKDLRLYCLRKYFFNNMQCDSAFRNFWFCHKSVDDHYISQDVGRHRQEYFKGYPSLRIYQPTPQFLTPEDFKQYLKEFLKTPEGFQVLYEVVKDTLNPYYEGLKKLFEPKT